LAAASGRSILLSVDQAFPFLFFVLFAIVAAGVAYFQRQRNLDRQRQLSALALAQGLDYSIDDPFDTVSMPFSLFQKGEGRGVENVVWGFWHDLEIRAFDYWYYEESTDAKGHTSRSYSRFDCVLAPVDARCPRLKIAEENVLTRIADALSFRDVEFESEEFNREFNVKCEDRKFANDLVDARMMRWLLGADADLRFEVAGRWLLAFSEKRRPEELVSLFASLGGFRDHLPRIVYELYPGRVG